MPSLSSEEVIEIDEYNAIRLDEYKGQYRLQNASPGDNNTFWLQWVYLSRWDKDAKKFKPDSKSRPMAVALGDKATAIATLEMLIDKIKDSDDVPDWD